MKILKLIPMLAALMMLAVPAWALDLQSAKQQGLVGETPQGYIGTVSQQAGVAQLVQEINGKRREEYGRISAQNGQTVAVVEKLAAQKLYERLQPGEYYQDASGKWAKK